MQYVFSGAVDSNGLVLGGKGGLGVDVFPTAPWKMTQSGTPFQGELPNTYPVLYWEIANISASGVLRWALGDSGVDRSSLMLSVSGNLPIPPNFGPMLECQRLNPGFGWSDFPRDGPTLLPQGSTSGAVSGVENDDLLRRRSALILKAETTNIEFSGSIYAWVPS